LLPRCRTPRPLAVAWMPFLARFRYCFLGHCRGHWAEGNTAGPGWREIRGSVRLENAGLEAHDRANVRGSGRVHVSPVGIDFGHRRHGACARWLHQMRTDLGWLGAIPEILQVGPAL